MWTRPERSRRSGRALALAALMLILLAPAARAADDEGEPPGQLRVVRVGDQTFLVDEVGNAILYQDPTPPAFMCREELEACVEIEVPAGAGIVVPGPGRAIEVYDASGQVLEEGEAPR